jgi:hypothetical protein
MHVEDAMLSMEDVVRKDLEKKRGDEGTKPKPRMPLARVPITFRIGEKFAIKGALVEIVKIKGDRLVLKQVPVRRKSNEE